MQYLYSHTPETLRVKFGDIVELGSQYGDNYESPHRILRNSQDNTIKHTASIDNLGDAVLVMDYLSTIGREWDYEPRIEVVMENGTTIKMPARGNIDHLAKLQKDDVVIIDEQFMRIFKSKTMSNEQAIIENEKLAEHIKRLQYEKSQLEIAMRNIQNVITGSENDGLFTP